MPIKESRLQVLGQMIQYIQGTINQNEQVRLNFICTHNSRRSQLSQIWAKTAALYNDIPVETYSGGVEVTAFNHRAVASCARLGFMINQTSNEDNPKYEIQIAKASPPLLTFSKLYNDHMNPAQGFAAIMTCSDADKNCPVIIGAEARIPLRYEDPKVFDDTPLEATKYDERNLQIASELLYVFSQIS